MTEKFDPYHRWLSIPPEAQPPHHYRLLGLKILEADLDVIESAADRQMTHVRTFQSGKFAGHSQRLLNEISSAKVTLLDPSKKAAYDAALTVKLNDAKQMKRAERPLGLAPRPSTQPAALRVAEPLMQRPLAPARPAAAPQPAAPQPEVPQPEVPAMISFAPAQHSSSTANRRRRPGRPVSGLVVKGIGALVGLAVLGVVAAIFRPWEMPPTVVVNPDDEQALIDHSDAGAQPPTRPENNPAERPVASLPQFKPLPQVPIVPVKESPTPALPEVDNRPAANRQAVKPANDLARRRAPVPSKAERDAKRTSIDAIFQSARANTPDKKASLAADILRTARETSDDAIAQFEMLNMTRELAAEAARIGLAFAAIDLLEQQFDADADADALRILTITQGAKADLPHEAKHEVVQFGVELADKFAAADRYDDAGKLLNGLIELSRKARDPQVAAALTERRRANGDLFAAYKIVQASFDKLQQSPDDPAANLAVGRFHLLLKNDAARGLAYLAKGGDDPLADAAHLELANPQTPAEQVQLADRWWKIAEQERDKEKQKKLHSRALAWYRCALPKLRGLDAVEPNKRSQELVRDGVSPANLHLDLGIFSRPPPAEDRRKRPVHIAEGLIAHWNFDEGNGDIVSDSAGGHHGLVQGAVWTQGVYGRALRFDGINDRVVIRNADPLNIEGEITLAAWVRPHSVPPPTNEGRGFANIIAHGFTTDPQREVSLRLLGGPPNHAFDIASWTGEVAGAQAPVGELSVWTSVVGVYGGKSWRLYVNGIIAAVGHPQSQGAVQVATGWAIGGHPDQAIRHFHGDIDDVRIFNRALTGDEIAVLAKGE